MVMKPRPKFFSMTVLGLSALLVLVAALALGACGGRAATNPDETSAGAAAAADGAGSGPGAGSAGGASVGALDMDPSDPSVLYAATTEGLYKSSDGAESWSRLPGTSGGIYSTVAVDPRAPSTIYAIGPNDVAVPPCRLQRSDDGGATWVNLSDAGSPRIYGYEAFVWFDVTATPSTVYAWGVKAGDWHVYRSSDRGETWTRDPAEERNPPWDPRAVPRRMSGAERKALDAFMAPFRPGSIANASIVVREGATRALYIAGGRPRVDPQHPSVFYAGTMLGVYKSLDGGGTWKRASAGLGATKGQVP
jgi:hypothetical protein